MWFFERKKKQEKAVKVLQSPLLAEKDKEAIEMVANADSTRICNIYFVVSP